MRLTACSFGWWLMAGAGLFWEKSTAGWWLIRPVLMGFHKCFMHIKYNTTLAKFHFFLHETLRREKERISPWWNLWAQFHMRWKLCETPLSTNRVSPCNYAIKPYNEREVVGPLSLWNCAMKLCIEGDIYSIPKFHILETGTVKLSIETGLSQTNKALIIFVLDDDQVNDWRGFRGASPPPFSYSCFLVYVHWYTEQHVLVMVYKISIWPKKYIINLPWRHSVEIFENLTEVITKSWSPNDNN
jgi:hypothetical protein